MTTPEVFAGQLVRLAHAIQQGAAFRERSADADEFIFSFVGGRILAGVWGAAYEYIAGGGQPIQWDTPEQAEWVGITQVRRIVKLRLGLNIYCAVLPNVADEHGTRRPLIAELVTDLGMQYDPPEVAQILRNAAHAVRFYQRH